MPSKTNGEPVENGVNGTKDVEMKDDVDANPASLKGGKGKKVKEGEEEMTVVVPPSKGKGLSKKDNEGDVAMDGEEVAEDEGAVKEDPVVKTVAGMLTPRAVGLG
jgi:26S proteasome regulatory subunit N3